MNCTFGSECRTVVRHDMHLFHEPESPLGMTATRSSVTVYLRDGRSLTAKQPDAIKHLRATLRAEREAAEAKLPKLTLDQPR
jgi:hypothetical protein